jgi:hypothetical protein
MSDKDLLHEVNLRLKNKRTMATTLYVEPFGLAYEFNPEDDVVIVAMGPNPIDPEIVYEDERVTYWGWPGSDVQVFKNGQELVNGKGLYFPILWPKPEEDPS